MRLKKSIYNGLTNSFILIIRSILMFVVRIVFVKTLGKELLGVDSLFTNLLLVLSIADSGMSTAISYTLYKPLSDKDYDRVSSLMTFYKKVYYILGILITVVGLLFIPFLHIFVKNDISNIYLFYLIYLLTTSLPYFISYKDALLNADQNLYKSGLIVGSTFILLYLLRILFLILVPDFLIFSLIQLIMMFIQRILVNKYITKNYDYVDYNSSLKLSKGEEKKIYKSVFSIFTNKLGRYLVNGTDNIIISAIPNLGLGIVAVYANYYSVVGAVDSVIGRGLSGIISSFGDLAVNESKKIQKDVFNIINFFSNFIYGLFSVGFLILLSLFINICFGVDYELGFNIVLLVSLNFYMLGIIKPLEIIKEATGNYVKDRYANMIQAVINVVLSIILGYNFGLFGIIISTLISYILVPLWNMPYIAFKYIFDEKPFNYFCKQLGYFITIVIAYLLSSFVVNLISMSNKFLLFSIRGIVVVIIYIVIFSLLYHNTEEYNFFLNKIKKIKKRGV